MTLAIGITRRAATKAICKRPTSGARITRLAVSRQPDDICDRDRVAQKSGIPGGVIGLAFGFGAIWVVDRIEDGSLPNMLKGLLLRWVTGMNNLFDIFGPALIASFSSAVCYLVERCLSARSSGRRERAAKGGWAKSSAGAVRRSDATTN